MSLPLLLPSKHHKSNRTKFICCLNAGHVYERWLWSLLPLSRTWFYSRICNICLVFISISSINSLHSIFQKFLCTPISLSANSQTKIENYYTHWNGIKMSHLSQSWENCIVIHLQLETSSTNNDQLIIFYNTGVKQWRLKHELKFKALMSGQEYVKKFLVTPHFYLLTLN